MKLISKKNEEIFRVPTIYHPTEKHSWYYNGPPPTPLDHIKVLMHKRVQRERLKKKVGSKAWNL
jgi:hypothetical protein